MTPPITLVDWKPAWRIIPSRFPPISLFERIAPPEDMEALFAVEALTNPRLRDEVGDIQLVPREDRITGPGTSIIMAAFTHPNPEGSRFTNGMLGVFYAANDLDTAIAETRHHRERFLRDTSQSRLELDMRVYLVDLAANLHDLRGRQAELPLIYAADNYAAGQHFAAAVRNKGSDGIVYDSLRRAGGECAAVFRPRLLSNCRQERHLCYVWDGQKVTEIYEKKSYSASA